MIAVTIPIVVGTDRYANGPDPDASIFCSGRQSTTAHDGGGSYSQYKPTNHMISPSMLSWKGNPGCTAFVPAVQRLDLCAEEPFAARQFA
jgi:hypothetical protein